MSYNIEILIADTWEKLRTSAGEIYEFSTYQEAEKVAKICYPDQLRFKPNDIRIVEVEKQ